MVSEKDRFLLWTEVYNGIPRGDNCVNCGWTVFPKDKTLQEARDAVVRTFKTKSSYIVLTYTVDRCSRGFRANDRILGVFG